MLLELARILKDGPSPKRTILFASFSGEEQNLLGSTWYVRHPTRPLANTVAMINVDHVGLGNGKLTVGVANMSKNVAALAAKQGRAIRGRQTVWVLSRGRSCAVCRSRHSHGGGGHGRSPSSLSSVLRQPHDHPTRQAQYCRTLRPGADPTPRQCPVTIASHGFSRRQNKGSRSIKAAAEGLKLTRCEVAKPVGITRSKKSSGSRCSCIMSPGSSACATVCVHSPLRG